MTAIADLQLDISWDPPDDHVAAPELRETWARLTLEVGSEPVTLVEDVATRSVRRGVYVSLYPLAEWIATNWWLLQFDRRRLAGPRSHDPRRMRSADDGFLWPNLSIVAMGETTELEWRSDGALRLGSPIRYLTAGRALVLSDRLVIALAALVEAVIDRLVEAGITDTFLQEEWSRSTRLVAEERDFCRAAAQLGLDPFAEGIELAGSIEAAFEKVGPDVWDDFLDAAVPSALETTAEWVESSASQFEELTHTTGRVELGMALLREVATASAPAGLRPWDVGWAAARSWRQQLGLAPDEILPDLGVASMRNLREGTPPMTLARAEGDEIGMISSRWLDREGKRFHQARALWHTAQRLPGEHALITLASNDRQSIGRAFAAEVLVPAEGLSEMLDGDLSGEALAAAADHFGAPIDVVRHQVENQLD